MSGVIKKSVWVLLVMVVCVTVDIISDPFPCYSCSQQEAYEEPGKKNGLYAQHLLRHIRRDARIEIILMDVARGTIQDRLIVVNRGRELCNQVTRIEALVEKLLHFCTLNLWSGASEYRKYRWFRYQ